MRKPQTAGVCSGCGKPLRIDTPQVLGYHVACAPKSEPRRTRVDRERVQRTFHAALADLWKYGSMDYTALAGFMAYAMDRQTHDKEMRGVFFTALRAEIDTLDAQHGFYEDNQP